jgi:hypothetical protein
MKFKKLSLLFIPFLLSGCDFDFFGLIKPTNNSEDQKESKTNDKTDGKTDEKTDDELTAVTIVDDFYGTALNNGDNLESSSTHEKLATYWNNIENGLMQDYSASSSNIKDNGKDNYYLTLGSQKYDGNITFNFSKSIYKVKLTLCPWYKTYSGGQTLADSAAKVTFSSKSYNVLLPNEGGEPQGVTLTTDVGSATSLKIESREDSSITDQDHRVVLKKITIYYQK